MTCDLFLHPDDRVKGPAWCSPRSQTAPVRRGSIGGLIIDWTTDLPVAGAEVLTVPPTERVHTDDLGVSFIQRNVRAGDYTVLAEKAGLIPDKPEGYRIRVGPDSMSRCDLPMRSRVPLSRAFRLAAGERERITLDVEAPCLIEVVAEWAGTAKTLSLILNGPGKTGYYARENGASPLRLTYSVAGREVVPGKKWTVTLANFMTRESARGEIWFRLVPAF